MDLRTAHALIRFGLGPRPGETPPADPARWLADQLYGTDPDPPPPAPTTAAGLGALRSDRESKPPPGESKVRATYRTDAAAALDYAIATGAPFRERLVWFWANHFTVSTRQGGAASVAGAFVAEAIRPHITGRFQDMLLAVMRHPAMLLYLDNAGSIGPGSRAGQRTHGGLNENLARECMELHTVTPAAGYTQADVTNFARILTGWSVDLKADPPGFVYRPNAHEPGAIAVMGRWFPEGEQGGTAALEFLAAHPATHRALAAKLVRHFVADDPQPAAVKAIEGVLRETGGDLRAASVALIGLEAAWQPGTKLRTPVDLVVATVRALGLPPDNRPDAVGIVAGLGQPLWTAPLPNGWPDRAADWATPDAMLRRIDWVNGVSGRASQADPMVIAEACLGPILRAETADALRRAASRREALILLLASPEFQRR